MKKRILALFLALTMCLALLPAAALAADGGFTIEDGVLTEYNGPGGDVTIPSSVTSIGDDAFEYCTGLTGVTIPDSVTSIGNSAFSGCTGLTAVSIPDSVTSIGAFAFYDCHALTGVTIPSGVTSIEWNTFGYCVNLTSVTIPNSVTSIEGSAFHGCIRLTSVTIPDSVTTIGQYAFCHSGLTAVTIPGSVTSIGLCAFGDCTGLTSVTISAGITNIRQCAFQDCTSLTSVTIPNSVINIGDGAFYGCTSLTGIIIPNSVTSIDDSAFYGCTDLTAVNIPDGVINIGKYAFYGCTGLTAVNIPDGVINIGKSAFYGCTGLTGVTIPDSVTSIGTAAFSACANLSAIQVGTGNNTYASIDGVLFTKDRKTLVAYPGGKHGSYTISNSVTSIGDKAFSGCAGLTDVVIPNNVTGIGDEAFYGCKGLTGIQVDAGNQEYVSIDGVLFTKDGKTLLAYPGGKEGAYIIPDSVTSIGWCAFLDCTSLTGVTIPSSVGSVRNSAFFGCTGLTSVTISSGVTGIEESAFSGCTGLTTVTIPDSVTSIGMLSFHRCTSLKDIYYGGTEAQWKAIMIADPDGWNACLLNAAIHYNSAGPARSGTAYASTQTVMVDGKAVELQTYALKDANGSDTNYVKLRDMACVLNGTAAQFGLVWDEANQSIAVTSKSAYTPNGSEMRTPFSGNRTYMVSASPVYLDGKQVELEAILLTDNAGNGYTYFKIRDLGEALNFNVGWNAQGIFIETDRPYSGTS